MLSYHYCNCALIVFITTAYLFFVKKHIKDTQSILFELMLWSSIFYCIFDVLSLEAIKNVLTVPKLYFYLMIYLYYIMQSLIPILSALYVMSVVNQSSHIKPLENYILFIPIIVSFLTILTNPLTKAVFYLDPSGSYVTGRGITLLYLIAGVYLVYDIIYIIHYRAYIMKDIHILFIFLVIAIVASVLAEFVFGVLQFRHFGIATCDLLVLIIIQNSDEQLHEATGLFSFNTLMRRCQLYYRYKKPFTLVLIKINDQALIDYTFGLNYWFEINNAVIEFLNSNIRLYSAYYVEDGCFAIIPNSNLSNEEADHIIQQTLNHFQDSRWSINNTDINISTQMLKLSCPKDALDINDIIYYKEYFTRNVIDANNKLITPEAIHINECSLKTEYRRRLWELIESKKYKLIYMPIYSVFSQKIISSEVLLELELEKSVYIPIEELDKVTEHNDQLMQLYMKIFDDVCAYLKEVTSVDSSIQHINLNISTVQLMQDNLISQFTSIINKHGLVFSNIGFEISETTASYAQPMIRRNILKLKNLGALFILDQFGTGYTNLDYLKNIPAKYIKLDRNLISTCFDNKQGYTVLKSTIAMIKQLNYKTIAEGADTADKIAVLTELGVDYLQGTSYCEVPLV